MSTNLSRFLRRSLLLFIVLLALLVLLWKEDRSPLAQIFTHYFPSANFATVMVPAVVLCLTLLTVWVLRSFREKSIQRDGVIRDTTRLIMLATLTAFTFELLPACAGSSGEVKVVLEDAGQLTPAQQAAIQQAAAAVVAKGGGTVDVTIAEAGMALLVITIVVVTGVIVVIKVSKASKKIEERRKKQIDDANGDDKDSLLNLPPLVEYGASFVSMEPVVPPLSDTSACSFTVTSSAVTAKPVKTHTDLESFVTKYALSLDQSSFSLNRQTVGSLTNITFSGGMLSVHVDGYTNKTISVSQSSDLAAWQAMGTGLENISVPDGAVVMIEDAYSPPSTNGFYRVMRQ